MALGTTDARRLAQVRSLLDRSSPDLKAALHDTTAARNVVFALLVRTKPALQSSADRLSGQNLWPRLQTARSGSFINTCAA